MLRNLGCALACVCKPKILSVWGQVFSFRALLKIEVLAHGAAMHRSCSERLQGLKVPEYDSIHGVSTLHARFWCLAKLPQQDNPCLFMRNIAV